MPTSKSLCVMDGHLEIICGNKNLKNTFPAGDLAV